MRFCLMTLIAVVTYCGMISAAIRHFSVYVVRVPSHWANIGTMRAKVDHQIHDIELIVWLPVLVLASYFYFRLSTASWSFRLVTALTKPRLAN
ncbi:MAG: hypothetical protein CMJ64_18415 [Planctomycetaceae bacterium]|nr:hypothetical protein [Planctomycetaceae bacterium]